MPIHLICISAQLPLAAYLLLLQSLGGTTMKTSLYTV